MILVTGAAGKTGRAVIKALLERGESLRGFVRRHEQAEELARLGVDSSVVGDMNAAESYVEAMQGVRAV